MRIIPVKQDIRSTVEACAECRVTRNMHLSDRVSIVSCGEASVVSSGELLCG